MNKILLGIIVILSIAVIVTTVKINKELSIKNNTPIEKNDRPTNCWPTYNGDK